MQIDWFTFLAQIVNFLILIYLLHRFLYGPITRAMRRREERIAARFAEAEAQARQVQEEGELFRAQRRELEGTRDEYLAEARAEAAELRRAMLLEVRQDVENLRKEWYEAVERERHAILLELRSRVGRQVMTAARRALASLADSRLEESVTATFLDRIKELAPPRDAYVSQDERTAADPVVVRSAFALPAEARRRVTEALRTHYADSDGDDPLPPMRFELAEELVCGIEVQVRDRRIGWNIRDYLLSLEETLDQTLAAESPAFRPRTPFPETGSGEGLFLA